jgi:serine protease AprX
MQPPLRPAIAALVVAFVLAALLAPLPTAPGVRVAFLLASGDPLPTGARVLQHLPVAGALVIEAPVVPAGAARLDEPLGFNALLGDNAGGPRLDSGVATVGADIVWEDGIRGEGAVVALIDSGVAPVETLNGAIAGEIDFTGTGGGDPYGHGTFMASLIAGRGTGGVAPGVAPAAGVLSLKVGRPDGSTDLATVLAALQWLDGPGRAAGIRVATMALGVEAGTPAAEFLDRATERLADGDVLVIAAAGNDGPGQLNSPATSTGTFSVGALDDNGTAERSDDVIAAFSGSGLDRAGVAQPDSVAPGVSVTGAMHPSSQIYQENPQGVVDGELFRGSGTSMATALTAGVAALAVSARPDLGGGPLHAALRNDAGLLDAPDAVATALEAPEPPPAAGPGAGNGNGHGPSVVPPGLARRDGALPPGLASLLAGQPSPGAVRWTAVRWTAVRWTAVRWTVVRWTAVRWTAVRWTGTGWGDATWAGDGWAAVRWTGGSWAAALPATTSWLETAVGFDAVRWTAVRWTAVRWTTVRWTTVRWTTVRWT